MKVELSVWERLWLLNNALPRQGKVTTLKIVQQLIADLGLSGEEFAQLGVEETDDGKITWSQEKDREMGPKEIEFSAASLMLVADKLKAMSEAEELDLGLVSLYDKFVGEG